MAGRGLFCWVVLLLAIEPVFAAVPLTWPECVQLAARNNPELLAALASSESSRALYLRSYNGVLPQLSLTNTYSRNKSGSGAETKVWTAGGSASLDLFDVSQWATIQLASAGMRETKANFRVASSNVLLDLYRSFTGVLYSQEEIQVNMTIRDTWKVNAQMVKLRYQSGRESKGNSMNTQAQSLQADLAVQQSERGLRVAQQQLSQSIGQDHFSALAVTGTWTAPAVPPRPDFDAMLATHPQIESQAAVVDQARASIMTARSALLPTLSLNYTQGTRGVIELPTSPFWTFVGTLNYPLFSGGPTFTYYATQAAQRAYDKSSQDLRSLRSRLRTDLESAWSAYAQAQDQVRIQEAFLQAAKQRKEESDVRYQSGLMTFENWILVVTDYVNSQTSFLRAEQNLILAEAQWRFASGEQLGD